MAKPSWQPDENALIPRCLKCMYPLVGLGYRGDCPECGRYFDLSLPNSFTCKPPFLFWTYWMPGLLMAVGGGVAVLFVLGVSGSIGVGATLALPFAIGVVLGYGIRGKITAILFLSAMAMTGVIAALVAMHPAAFFCGVILAIICVVPVLIGTFVGIALRMWLKTSSKFKQRWYLPMLFLLAFPIAVDRVERVTRGEQAEEIVATSLVMDAAPMEVWNAMAFYEEMKHPSPWLLRLGVARPVGANGRAREVGDVKVCLYVRGQLRKRVTAAEPGRRLDFEVTRQDHVENHAITLRGGNFTFEPVDAARTRVVLTTRYVPLLTPRFAWRGFEHACVHSLHGHVLEGMRLNVRRQRDVVMAEGAP